MKATNLKNPFYHYGNKGAVWSNETHIAMSGSFGGTLCETPMLATNWARIWEHETVGCPDCLTKWLELEGYILECDIKAVEFDEYNRPFYRNNGKIMLSKRVFEYQVSN